VLLHPPYTLWHLSYVAIGATIATRFDGGRLAATLAAFLDENFHAAIPRTAPPLTDLIRPANH